MAKEIKVGERTVSQEEVEKALALLENQKLQRAKQRDKVNNDPMAKAKAAERSLRLRVRNTLLQKKAVAAGITVSDKEIDSYLATAPAA